MQYSYHEAPDFCKFPFPVIFSSDKKRSNDMVDKYTPCTYCILELIVLKIIEKLTITHLNLP